MPPKERLRVAALGGRPAWVTAVLAAFIFGFATMALGVARAQEADNTPPVAVDDAATTSQNTPVTISVLANDTDADGNALSVIGATAPTHGSVLVNGAQTITYTPDHNFSGSDSFTYIISDAHGGVDTADVTVTVTSVNHAPVAGNDSASVASGSSVNINVLANDSDPDGNALTVSITVAPSHGTASVQPNGTITYTPTAGFTGTDTLTYAASDGSLSDTAVVTITVGSVGNTPPVAVDDTATTVAGAAVVIPVLANDTDANGNTLSVDFVADPAHGTAVVNANQTVTYTPDAGFVGTDTFIYLVGDGQATDVGQVTVTVTGQGGNQAPVAQNDKANTAVDQAVVIQVLANDTDPNGDALSVSGATTPAHGTAVVNANGTITYTPASGFQGQDAFTYVVTDGTASATATVTVDVGTTKAGIESTAKDACKRGGWRELGFRNQGQCIASIVSHSWRFNPEWWDAQHSEHGAANLKDGDDHEDDD